MHTQPLLFNGNYANQVKNAVENIINDIIEKMDNDIKDWVKSWINSEGISPLDAYMRTKSFNT
jgi:hypothetical protein